MNSTVQFVKEKERKTPIICKTDVLVVGGGVAGVTAAVAASREGVDVILAERYPFLGGLATGGNVLQWPGFNADGSSPTYGGISFEVMERVRKSGGVLPVKMQSGDCLHCDPEILKYILEQLLLESGVKILQHMFAVSVSVQNSQISTVIFETKAGRLAIAAKIFIEATGDGDLIFWSGAPFRKSSLPISFAWNFGGVDTDLIKKNHSRFVKRFQKLVNQINDDIRVDEPYPLPMIETLWCNGTYFYRKDPLSPFNLTDVGCKGRQRAMKILAILRKKMVGFQNAFLFNSSTVTGVRTSRQLDGQHVLTMEEMDKHIEFSDSIGFTQAVQHPSNKSKFRQRCFQIPYGCLLPKRVNNLLVAGRCISVTPSRGKFKGPLEHVRGIPQCMVTGQAAGCAAGLCCHENTSPSNLSIDILQQTLVKQGARIKE